MAKIETKTAGEWLALAAGGKLAMNSKTAAVAPQAGEWIMEPKYDGWRILAVVTETGARLFARSGNGYTGKLPHVEAELTARFPVGTVLDGEAVALRIDGDRIVNEWGTAQSAMTKLGGSAAAARVTFVVFDLLAHGGIDARPLPFGKRRELLDSIFASADFDAVQLSVQLPATDANYEALVTQGFEGAMVKRIGSPYASGKRSADSLKMKAVHTEDVVVMGFKEGENGFKGLVGALVFGQYEDGQLVEIGRCSGMDFRTRVEISQNREAWLGRVIEVRHMGVMPSGAWRHPQMKRVRADKTAGECVRSVS